MLTEFGLEFAAAVGEAWAFTYEALCHVIGVDPRLFDEFEASLEQPKDDS